MDFNYRKNLSKKLENHLQRSIFLVKVQTKKSNPLQILFNWFAQILGASKYTSKEKNNDFVI